MSIETEETSQRRLELSDQTMNFVAGTFAGVAQTFTGHPFDTLKVRLQTGDFKGTFDCLSKTVKGEGMAGLYKGMTSPLLASALFTSVMFGSFESFKQFFQDGTDRQLTFTEFTMATCATGFIETVLYCPFEHLKTRMQTQATNAGASERLSLGRLAYDVVKKGGFRNLFKGFVPELIRECPGNMAYFGTYGIFREAYSKVRPNHETIESIVFSGGMAGVAYWGTTFPVDLVKSRMQADNLQNPRFNGFVHCVRVTYQELGFRGFYRGLLPCLVRAFPVNAASFMAFEYGKEWLETL